MQTSRTSLPGPCRQFFAHPPLLPITTHAHLSFPAAACGDFFGRSATAGGACAAPIGGHFPFWRERFDIRDFLGRL